jgi:hypothetical protein
LCDHLCSLRTNSGNAEINEIKAAVVLWEREGGKRERTEERE